MEPQLQLLEDTYRGSLKPPPDLTVSEWADQYRFLSAESSAEPGPWNTERAPYQREIMDAATDITCEHVVVMSSAQVGKTEILNNIIGYHIDYDPCPMLLVQPTLELANTWSKDRLSPMLRDSPALQGKVGVARAKDSINTILHKVFPGGHITMAGSNSPASLAQRPIRLVLCDEVDRYPASAGTEGDPVNLAVKRTTAFWNRKIVLTSTPTVKNVSRIEAAYEASSKGRLFVPCPECGHRQYLKWAQVKWTNRDPLTAKYECEVCKEQWGDAKRWAAIRWGKFVHEFSGNRIRGFHLNEICSPWVRLSQMVADFLQAKKLPETLKTWINTSLGETYEEGGESIDPQVLYRDRRQEYPSELDMDVLIVTAGIDQQKDWLACEVVGWREDLSSISLEYREFVGSTRHYDKGAWVDLRQFLINVGFKHECGVPLGIQAAAVDTHGTYTSEAYKFCKALTRRRVYAVRGRGGMGLPVVTNISKNNEQKVTLYTLGVDTLKQRVYSRLYEVTEPGPGYCVFPTTYNLSYFEGLTSEMLVTKYKAGRAETSFVAKAGTRQEPLDCRVYAVAALEILRPVWGMYRKMVERSKEESTQETESTAPLSGRRRSAAKRRKPNRITSW